MRIMNSFKLKDGYTSFDNIAANATYAEEQMDLWLAGELSAYDYTGSGYAFLDWPLVTDEEEAEELISLAEEAVNADPHPVMKKKLEFLRDSSVPEVEVIFSDGYTGVKGYPAAGSPEHGNQYFTLIAALMHPLSRGSIHINAEDPEGKPLIDPRFLTNEHDVRAVMAAVKYCRRAASTAPMSGIWDEEYEPGTDVQTDDEWRQYVLDTALSIFHPVGTCAMLPKADDGVVDSELKVYGVDNLRVVDASVIPVLISAHIQTAVYGIAEIAAEKIIAAAA